MATSASPTIHIAVDTSQARKGINELKSALSELQEMYNRVTKDSVVAAKAGTATHKALTAETKKTAAATTRTGTAVRQTTSAMRDQTRAMYDLRGAARGLSGSLGMLWTTYGSLAPLLAGAAIAGTARSAFNVGKDLEYRLAMVEAVSGQRASIDDLMPAVLGSMKTPLEAAEAMQALAQAGMKVKEAVTALPAVTSLATVGELAMSDAAVTLTASINAFNLEATDAARVADVFAKTASISTTTVAQITGAMRQASTNAGQFRISVEETSAALAVMAERNITGSLAGTAFRNMTKELYTPIARGAKALKQMGVSAYDSEGKMRGFIPILKDLHSSLSVLNEQSKDAMLEAIFGERGSRAIKPILADFDSYLRKVEELGDATGFLAQANAKLLNTTEGAMNRLQSTMEQVKVKAFDEAKFQIVATIREIDETLKTSDFGNALQFIIRNVADLTKALASNLDLILKVGAGYAAIKIGTGVLALSMVKLADGIKFGSNMMEIFKRKTVEAGAAAAQTATAVGVLSNVARGLSVATGIIGVGMMLYTLYQVISDINKIKREVIEDKEVATFRREFKDFTDQLVDQAEQMKATYAAIGDDNRSERNVTMMSKAAKHVEELRRKEQELNTIYTERKEALESLFSSRTKEMSINERREFMANEEVRYTEMLVGLMDDVNNKRVAGVNLEEKVTSTKQLQKLFNEDNLLKQEAVKRILDSQIVVHRALSLVNSENNHLTDIQRQTLESILDIQNQIVKATQAELNFREQISFQSNVSRPISSYEQLYKRMESAEKSAQIVMKGTEGVNTERAKQERAMAEKTLGMIAETKAMVPTVLTAKKELEEAYHEGRDTIYKGADATIQTMFDNLEAMRLNMSLVNTGKGGGRGSFDDPNTILKRMTVSTITDQLKHQASVAKVAEAHLRDVRDAQLELDKQYMSEGALYALAARYKAEDKYNSLLDKAKENIEKLQEAMKAATDETVIANAQAALDLEYKRVEALEEQKRLAGERAAIEARERHDADNTFFNRLRKHYSDAANDAENLSDVMKNAGVEAFATMGGALEEFVVKGKLDFASLTTSILEDMMRMILRWAVMQALGMFSKGGDVGGVIASDQFFAGFGGSGRGWTGGYTGDGGKFQPMGVVHGGEFVLNKEATSKIGLPLLEYMNRTGRVPERGYAFGGGVGISSLPSSPISRGPTKVEVNIINQGGEPVTTEGQPRVSMNEMGKIIVDVMIRDLKNSGPYARQILGARRNG